MIGNHWDKESHRHHIREYRNIFCQSLAHGLYKAVGARGSGLDCSESDRVGDSGQVQRILGK